MDTMKPVFHPLEQRLKEFWGVFDFRFVGKYHLSPDKNRAWFVELRTMKGERLYFPEDKETGLLSGSASASFFPNEKLVSGQFYQFYAILNPNIRDLGKMPLIVKPQPFGKIPQSVQSRIKKELLVKEIFQRNGAEPHDARNLANSLRNFEIELYTKTERFIFELLQNADDFPESGKDVAIKFEILKENIFVQHTGRPFNQKDVESICDIGNSSKLKDISATGYKGIGFKSVFTHARRVFIVSGGYQFCFNREHPTYFNFDLMFPKPKIKFREDEKINFIGPSNIPWQLKPIWREKNLFPEEVHTRDDFFEENVSFCLEFGQQNIETFNEKAKLFFNEPRFLLFLRNISKTLLIGSGVRIATERRIENGKIRLITGQGEDQYITFTSERSDFSSSVANLKNVTNIPPKLLESPFLILSFAALLSENDVKPYTNAPLFTYLPTEDRSYGFPFLVNGDFVTTSNREQILPENEWNVLVFEQIGYQVLYWIRQIVTSGSHKKNAYSLIPEKFEGDSPVKSAFNRGFERALAEVDFIINRNGETQLLKNTLLDKSGLTDLLGEQFEDLTGCSSQPMDGSVNTENVEYLIQVHRTGAIFDFDDVKNLCSTSNFRGWLAEPAHNVAFLKYLVGRKWLDRLSGETIFLDQNENLCKAGEIYNGFDTDLELLDWLPLRYLHSRVAEGLKAFSLPISKYHAPTFIKSYIIDNQSGIDGLLKDKVHYIKFYRYIFRHRKSLSDSEYFGDNKLTYFKVWGHHDEYISFSDNIYLFNSSLRDLLAEGGLPHGQFYLLSEEFQAPEDKNYEWVNFWQRFGVKQFTANSPDFFNVEIIGQAKNLKNYFDRFDSFDTGKEPSDSFKVKRQANIALWAFIGSTLKNFPEIVRKQIASTCGEITVFTTDIGASSPLNRCYLSQDYTGNPTLEQLAEQFTDIPTYFISGVYAHNPSLKISEWKHFFELCGAQNTTQNFAERLADGLKYVEDQNLIPTTRFLFENREIFKGSDPRLLALKIKRKNGISALREAVLGFHYTQSTLIDTVLPSITLPNLVSDEYSHRRLGEWTDFFTSIGVIRLNTEDEVIAYKIDFLLAHQDVLNTNESTLNLIAELASLHKEDKIKDHYEKLEDLRLLLNGDSGDFLEAGKCHFSAEYRPRLDLENLLSKDESPNIFVSPLYIQGNRDTIRGFFRKIKVCDDFQITEVHSEKRSNLPPSYRAAIDSQNSYIVQNARQYGSQHWIAPWLRLNYDPYLSNHQILTAFWEKIVESSRFRELLFKKLTYKCAFNSYSILNYIAFRLTKEPLLPTVNGQLSKSTDLFSIRFKEWIDDPALLPAFDLTSITLESTTLEQWLGIQQSLSLELCLKRVMKVQDHLLLKVDGIWARIKDLLANVKTALSSRDTAALGKFSLHGTLPNQLGEWKPLLDLYYIADDFDLGIGNSPWLIANDLLFFAPYLGLKKLTESDFPPEFRDSILDQGFLEMINRRARFIALAENQSDWPQGEARYLTLVAPYQFYKTTRIAFSYADVEPHIENTDRNFFHTGHNVYFIGNWTGSRAAEIFGFLHGLLNLKKVSVKILQDILLNTEAEILALLEEKNLTVPEEWKPKPSSRTGIQPIVSPSLYQDPGNELDAIEAPSDDKAEVELAGAWGREIGDRTGDNNEAKRIALEWLKQNGYDCASHHLEYDQIKGVQRISDGQYFTVLVSSFKRGKLFLRPMKWLSLGVENTFLLAVGAQGKVTSFFNPQAVLDKYSRTLMRVSNNHISAENMELLADLNADVETMQFIFYDAEERYDAEFDTLSGNGVLGNVPIQTGGSTFTDLLD